LIANNLVLSISRHSLHLLKAGKSDTEVSAMIP
jgi:hypothetical protein